eukprot:900647-Prymnesium_polylepis.1
MSFASKCVNMLGQRAPIYSSEATAYLKHQGHTLKLGNATGGYDAFCRAWYAEYENHRAGYEAAASKHLASGGPAATGDVAAQLEACLGVEWFAMRGFDV